MMSHATFTSPARARSCRVQVPHMHPCASSGEPQCRAARGLTVVTLTVQPLPSTSLQLPPSPSVPAQRSGRRAAPSVCASMTATRPLLIVCGLARLWQRRPLPLVLAATVLVGAAVACCLSAAQLWAAAPAAATIPRYSAASITVTTTWPAAAPIAQRPYARRAAPL